MKGLWKYDVAVLALVAGLVAFNSHRVNQEEERARAVTAASEAAAAVAALRATPILLNPICPDQFVAQRGANEAWRVKCLTVSTVGSRAQE